MSVEHEPPGSGRLVLGLAVTFIGSELWSWQSIRKGAKFNKCKLSALTVASCAESYKDIYM